MNVMFLNPFVEAVSEVLMTEARVSTTRGKLTLQKSALTTDDITVLISLVGNVQGVVFYGMPLGTGLALVSCIMDQEFAELDSLAQSGVAELGNVITGQASSRLAQAGYACTISPPTLILGRGVAISTLDFSRIVVPMACGLGELVVHLAVRESPPKGRRANFVPVISADVGAASTVGVPSVIGERR